MGKVIDITGQKFGRLTVTKRVFPNDKYRHSMWLCKCECGNEKIVNERSLKGGLTKSCGCLQKEITGNLHRLKSGIATMRCSIRNYKYWAKSRELEYNLTEEQFKEITQKDCFYCGAKPGNISKTPNNNGAYIYNGIDRVDNKKGYTIDNVVPCCKRCNQAKKNYTLQNFQDWIEKIYNRFKGVK